MFDILTPGNIRPRFNTKKQSRIQAHKSFHRDKQTNEISSEKIRVNREKFLSCFQLYDLYFSE